MNTKIIEELKELIATIEECWYEDGGEAPATIYKAIGHIEALEQWQRMIMLKMQGETAHEFYESSGDKPPDSI